MNRDAIEFDPAKADPSRGSVRAILHHAHARFGHVTGLSMLDFGCGRGLLLDRLAACGVKTFGIVPATRHTVTDHQMLDAVPTEPTFDIIDAVHVLEHFVDPLSILQALRTAIRPAGILYIGTTTLDGVSEQGYRRYRINRHLHFSGFTQRSLTALLGRARFNVVAFYPGSKPARMRCVAEPVQEAVVITDPLHDARQEYAALAAKRQY